MGSRSQYVSILMPKMEICNRIFNDLNRHSKRKALLIAFMTILFMCVNISGALTLNIIAPTYAYIGDTVTYNYIVTNDGSIDLDDINITDSQFGTILVGSLPAFQSKSISYSHIINESNMPTLKNYAIAKGHYASDPNQYVESSQVSHTINLGFKGNLDVYMLC